jgi:para-nitrobenzyl esterase
MKLNDKCAQVLLTTCALAGALCAPNAVAQSLAAEVPPSLSYWGAMMPIAGDPVKTTSGMVAGTQLASSVRAYYGVPYAKPPVNDLRWRAPQPLQWQGVWNADKRAPQCVQPQRRHDINHYFGEEPNGEDCLYLNIWSPQSAERKEKLPVVVFIYGGGGTLGSSNMAVYDGEAMAKAGVVFVNFNYRVGLLGFMAHPELSAEQGGHSGNYGYMDQNVALKWVHENIAAFGGDPNKVVIMGQSFGAASVAAQIMSPRSKGLFQGAILSSGCNFTRESAPLSVGEQTGLEVQKQLGVHALAEMRNMTAETILRIQAESQVMVNNKGLPIPQIRDGYFLTDTTADTLKNHTGSAVPIIASSNSDDMDQMRLPLARAKSVAHYKELAAQIYGKDAESFLKLFPARDDAEAQAQGRNAAMAYGMLAGSRHCAELQAQYLGQKSYVDVFTQKHHYHNGVVLADQNTATVGAYHSADIPFWFGTLAAFNKLRSTRDWTGEDKQLAASMMNAVIAFAKTGSPSTAGLNWPEWSEKQPAYMLFGEPSKLTQMNIKQMDWLAAHPPAEIKLEAPTGLRARD